MNRRHPWKWNPEDKQRFNPMDDGVDEVVDIAILQVIESLRSFFTNSCTGIDNREFARLLKVSASSALKED